MTQTYISLLRGFNDGGWRKILKSPIENRITTTLWICGTT